MIKVTLGRTGLEVARLGFGTALYRHDADVWGPDVADELLNSALDAGINFIDTAYDYVDSEKLIGHCVGDRSDEYFLATKCGCTDTRLDRNSSDHLWTRDNLMRGLEGSLRRLDRGYIDVMQLHNPTVDECNAGKLVDALEEMRSRGAVHWIGVSCTLPHLPTFLEWGCFDVMQIPYSALERDHEEWIARAAEAGTGIIVRGGVAQGEPGAGRGKQEKWDAFERAGIDELRGPQESRSSFVLRYALSHPHVHAVIVGTTNLDHLKQNVAAAALGPLPAEVYAEAKRRLSAAGVSPAP